MNRHRLPAPARAISTAVSEAVAAAQARDAQRFTEAAEQLAALDQEQVGVVLGAVVRSLLEDMHPDGLSGEDVQDVLERCVRSAIGWLPEVDVDVLVVLLTGALGVFEADEQSRPPTGPQAARHAPLLVAYLLGGAIGPSRGTPGGSELQLAGYLTAAFAEIARAETIEMP
jgi:hypothetical protein